MAISKAINPDVGAPAGSNTQVQFNSSGVMGASSKLTFDGTDLTLVDNSKVTLGTGGDADLYYDGTNVILLPYVVGNGNFGIGTTSPDVAANGNNDVVVTISNSATAADHHAAILELNASTSTNTAEIGKLAFTRSAATNKDHASIRVLTASGDADAGANMLFMTKTLNSAIAERMRIASSGYVGIGNGNPDELLNATTGLAIGNVSDATSEITIATTTSGTGELNFTDTGNTTAQGYIRYFHDGNSMRFAANATEYMYLTTGGILGIREDTNGNMTNGIAINQRANDNEILALKCTDVAHGMTGLTETDTYGAFRKYENNGGGLSIAGYSDAHGPAGNALHLRGTLGEAADTTKSTSARGVVYMATLVKDGTAGGLVGSNGNLFAIGNSETTRFIFDAEGSGHADVEWTTYDTYNDLALISDMEDTLLAMESPDQTPRRHTMEATGIIGKDSWHMEDGKPRAMVNFTKLAMLHHGALIQTGDRFKLLEDRLEQTEAKLLLAETKLNLLEN